MAATTLTFRRRAFAGTFSADAIAWELVDVGQVDAAAAGLQVAPW